jgi:SpoVK/Ycf46/Vps4 family AAA+-type ATPase
MDGVEKLDYVLVIACTNKLDWIDDALLRPGNYSIHNFCDLETYTYILGRFDLTFGIGLPDFDDRVDIINKLVPNLTLEEVELIANNTKGQSGAGLHKITR